MISLLDYGAGNVRSLRNAIQALGFTLTDIERPEDILKAERLIFPGVGAFGAAMERLHRLGYVEPLKEYLAADRPFLGICIGLQSLFEGSEECPGVAGLGVIPGQIRRFDASRLSVPHMGWNDVRVEKPSPLFAGYAGEKLYFVHSYRAEPSPENQDWRLATTDYGTPFLSAVQRGRVAAVQFHPEKSGAAGLRLLGHFLAGDEEPSLGEARVPGADTCFAKRVIACLDVRTNDAGDLVVTKGDQYDVREAGEVRNLGKPVELAQRYYEDGADEVTFLNITAFRDFPLADQPMLEVLRRTSERVFVPLTIGGGIRSFTDAKGVSYSALDVADEYFRSGADKISIGSDAVHTVERYLERGGVKDGASAIEQISEVYGAQAVVISIDPRRVYVDSPESTRHVTVETATPGPNGERYCWFQCTVKGGREGRDVDAVELARACEDLGAGEILLNSIDRDGTGSGFDLELIRAVSEAVSIPVIASSGAGCVEHFAEVFAETGVEAALAAGIFHRREVPIEAVKSYLREQGVEIRA
ncbi:imidazole glycerol phosphate synthase HisHF [Imhoffiella purpurea]|uniref:Imidazole glycerol phosphate synthase subunit HisH n=1 Tax=Imhoffiella purpurea TaxID=1249627 RepID=W9VAJ3_9GAMM|nr:imidazole glycerol phosphate synthase HisHF [Imhoffiella purpurea]EXJ16633.1 Imidazole glycerol phosphate synthase amidotransferase subunit [Imhoffiella purpurea]